MLAKTRLLLAALWAGAVIGGSAAAEPRLDHDRLTTEALRSIGAMPSGRPEAAGPGFQSWPGRSAAPFGEAYSRPLPHMPTQPSPQGGWSWR